MKITLSEVIHVAKLARIKLDTDELGKFRNDLNGILEYMDMLEQVNTSAVVETVHTTAEINTLREDVVQQSQERADALLNAPFSKDGLIVVPKVIE